MIQIRGGLTEPEVREKLQCVTAFVIDQDGTTYLEQKVFPWTIPFLNGLKARGRKYLFLSNNSSKSLKEHLEKLISIGIDVIPEQILSSTDATLEYLKSLNYSDEIFLMATPPVEQDFEKAGFNIRSDHPRYVVLAYDLTLTFDKLDRACRFVRKGVPFIATHEDANWLIGPNDFRPDVGSLAAAITASTKVAPKFIGKPNTEMVNAFLKRLNVCKDEVALIGDKLNTDIRMGQDHGIFSFLVLSGQTSAEEIPDSPWQPDVLVGKTIDILDFL